MENRFKKGNGGGRKTSDKDFALSLQATHESSWDESSANVDGKKWPVLKVIMDRGVDEIRCLNGSGEDVNRWVSVSIISVEEGAID